MEILRREDRKIDLVVVQGKTWTLWFKVKDETGTVVDLRVVELRGQIRKSWNSATVVAEWEMVKTTPTEGEFKAVVPATVTESIPCGDTIRDPKSQYVYDIEIEFPDGTVLEVVKGRLFVEWEVTK